MYGVVNAFVDYDLPIAFSNTQYLVVTGLGCIVNDYATNSTPTLYIHKKTVKSICIGLAGGNPNWKYNIIALGY